jgi:hypothetical protein
MRRIKKAQTGSDTTRIKENPFMKARQLDSMKRKVQKSTSPAKKVLKKDVDLSAPGKEMMEQLKKKGSMPASQKNVGRKGIKVKAKGGKQMIKRADGSYSQRGLWDNIRAAAKRNKAAGKPGKKPTAAMLKQERKIKAKGK